MFYLLIPHTTGFLRPRKSKPFARFEDALAAGQALNLLSDTPDKLFVILDESQISAYSNISEPLPFNMNMFRFNRLTMNAEAFAPSAPNESMPSFTLLNKITKQEFNPVKYTGKPIHSILSEAGLSFSNASLIQNMVQYELGIVPLAPMLTPEIQSIYFLATNLFSSLQELNEWITKHIMDQFRDYSNDPLIYFAPDLANSSDLL